MAMIFAIQFQHRLGFNSNLRFHPKLSKFRISKTTANQLGMVLFRPLGSYERLLSRKSVGSDTIALSHGCVTILEGNVTDNDLLLSIEFVIAKHPMLRSIIKDRQWAEYEGPARQLSQKIFSSERVSIDSFDTTWRLRLERSFNSPLFDLLEPQWRLHHISSSGKHALVFTFNHGMDDQQSIQYLLKDMIAYLCGLKDNSKKSFPQSIEESLSEKNLSLSTILWALYQLKNSLDNPKVLPSQIEMKLKNDENFRSQISLPSSRSTIYSLLSLSLEETTALIKLTKKYNFSVTQFLSAIVASVTADLISSQLSKNSSSTGNILLRFLLSVGLRKYLNQPTDTVFCASGAIDYTISVPVNVRNSFKSHQLNEDIVNFVNLCKVKANYAINEMRFVPESVKLFDFGMKTVDIFQAVEMEAKNPKTLGRGYSCSVSNVGVLQFSSETDDSLKVTEVYYGTSQAQSGVLAQLSCTTVNGRLNACIQFPRPIVSETEAENFTQRIRDYLANLRHINEL